VLVHRDMRIATEEIFGPVVTVTAFNSDPGCRRLPNDRRQREHPGASAIVA
jgi:acyl-CoA reductase-like NAD-dependent aldehyde dehydrogenase